MIVIVCLLFGLSGVVFVDVVFVETSFGLKVLQQVTRTKFFVSLLSSLKYDLVALVLIFFGVLLVFV